MTNYDRGEEAYSRLKDHVKSCDDRHRDVISKIMSLQNEVTSLKERQTFFGNDLVRLDGKIDALTAKITDMGKKQMIMWAVLVASALGSPHLADFLKMFMM